MDLRHIQGFLLITIIISCQLLINVAFRYIHHGSLRSSHHSAKGNIVRDANFLDEEAIKQKHDEDEKNEHFEGTVLTEIDPSIKLVEDPKDWIYQFDYRKSHPFENQCRFPVIKHGEFSELCGLQYEYTIQLCR